MNHASKRCGFECVFSKKSDVRDFLDFSNIIPNQYYFHVAYASVFSQNKKIEIPPRFNPEFFMQLNQWAFASEGLVLHLYPNNANPAYIANYNEYMQSNCEMIILLYDFYYLEIYCKNSLWLQKLMDKAKDKPNAVFEEKYENSDPRTEMYV